MTEAERRDRLIKWLEEIKREVEQLMVSEYLFWELQKIVSDNDNFKDASGLFTRWIADGFLQSSMMAIRRQVKRSDESISLRGFLEEIKKFPQLVSREHYMGLYVGRPQFVVEIGEADYDNLAGKSADLLPSAFFDQQIEELSRIAKSIEAYADKRVAHFDRLEPARPFPTFNDLTAVIKVQEKLVILYWRLLKGGNLTTLLPTIIFDWQDVFRFAWKPENEQE